MVWDTDSAELLHTSIQQGTTEFVLAFSADGTHMLDIDGDIVQLWDIQSGNLVLSFEAPPETRSGAFSADGSSIAIGALGEVRIVDIETSAVIQTIPHEGRVTGVTFSPDGSRLLIGGSVLEEDPGHPDDGDDTDEVGDSDEDPLRILTLVVLATEERREYAVHSRNFALAFSPDGGSALVSGHVSPEELGDPAFGRSNRSIWGTAVLDLATGDVIRWFNTGTSDFVSFAPDGARVLIGTRAFDVQTGRELYAVPMQLHGINAIAFSPDGEFVVAGSIAGHVSLWPVEPIAEGGTPRVALETDRVFADHRGMIGGLDISEDGNTLITRTDSGVKLWDVQSGDEIRTVMTAPTGTRVIDAAISADGSRSLTGGDNGRVELWDNQTGELLHVFLGHNHVVVSVDMSRDGTRIASGGLDGTARVWNAESGESIHIIDPRPGQRDSISGLAFSPAGAELAVGLDEWIYLYNASNGFRLHELKCPGRLYPITSSVVFSPDEMYLSAACRDYAPIWDTRSGELVQQIVDDSILHVAFHPRGGHLLTRGNEQVAKLWALSVASDVAEWPAY